MEVAGIDGSGGGRDGAGLLSLAREEAAEEEVRREDVRVAVDASFLGVAPAELEATVLADRLERSVRGVPTPARVGFAAATEGGGLGRGVAEGESGTVEDDANFDDLAGVEAGGGRPGREGGGATADMLAESARETGRLETARDEEAVEKMNWSELPHSAVQRRSFPRLTNGASA